MRSSNVKSVAVIGAGAAGAITAAALQAEQYFDRIRVFERRETPGGVWIHDREPAPTRSVWPGQLPPETDPRVDIPENLPAETPPVSQERWEQTPIYESLTTNVPDIAMCFSDARFAYGPFVPHYVARQYIEGYFARHRTDALLQLNTTVEDVSRVAGSAKWRLTLRQRNFLRGVDEWWYELFDAVVLATGHYSVPFVPHVDGLDEYVKRYPGRVSHSKFYRSPQPYKSKRVLVVGNSASGHDVAAELVSTAKTPVVVSRRSRSKWEGEQPPPGIHWKPTIKSFHSDGSILFDDGTTLRDIDSVIYCTGYKASFPFWNEAANGGPLWDYTENRLLGNYQHTFLRNHPTIGVVGLPRTLTFRSFEYQAVALARLWSGRNAFPLPSIEEQHRWESDRARAVREKRLKFHDVPWENGETHEYLGFLFRFAGLGTLTGHGRVPPVLGRDITWAIENIHKYPEPGPTSSTGKHDSDNTKQGWVLVARPADSVVFV